jgi:hypothetical protein
MGHKQQRARKPQIHDPSLEKGDKAMSTRGWLTVDGLASAAGIDAEILRTGIESGRLDGWYPTVGGQLKFKPATIEFVRWSDRLADAVVNGHVSVTEAARLLERRSRRLTLGLPR